MHRKKHKRYAIVMTERNGAIFQARNASKKRTKECRALRRAQKILVRKPLFSPRCRGTAQNWTSQLPVPTGRGAETCRWGSKREPNLYTKIKNQKSKVKSQKSSQKSKIKSKVKNQVKNQKSSQKSKIKSKIKNQVKSQKLKIKNRKSSQKSSQKSKIKSKVKN